MRVLSQIATKKAVLCVFFAMFSAVALAADTQTDVSVTTVFDDPEPFVGKSFKTNLIISVAFISPVRVRDAKGNVVFDGAVLSVRDSSRPQGESFGNSLGLIDDLNVVMLHKQMARDLKDALTKGGTTWDCEATVSVTKIRDRWGKMVPAMVIHGIETTVVTGANASLTGLATERVKVSEDMYQDAK
jgi:hypothetical protein